MDDFWWSMLLCEFVDREGNRGCFVWEGDNGMTVHHLLLVKKRLVVEFIDSTAYSGVIGPTWAPRLAAYPWRLTPQSMVEAVQGGCLTGDTTLCQICDGLRGSGDAVEQGSSGLNMCKPRWPRAHFSMLGTGLPGSLKRMGRVDIAQIHWSPRSYGFGFQERSGLAWRVREKKQRWRSHFGDFTFPFSFH